MLGLRCIYLIAAILIACSSLWCQVEAKNDRDSGRVSPCVTSLKLLGSSKHVAVEDIERDKSETKQSETDDWGVLREAPNRSCVRTSATASAIRTFANWTASPGKNIGRKIPMENWTSINLPPMRPQITEGFGNL